MCVYIYIYMYTNKSCIYIYIYEYIRSAAWGPFDLGDLGEVTGPAAIVPSPGTNEHHIGRTELVVTRIESP